MTTDFLPRPVTPASFKNANIALSPNGHSAIQLKTYDECKTGSMFLQESTLLFIREGRFKFCYGKLEYEVRQNQIAFLKKDILFQYEAECLPGEKAEYVIFSLTSELLKEFTKLTKLCAETREEAVPAMINSADRQLQRYIDSIEPYFNESKKVEVSLIKIKLLELLFYLFKAGYRILEQLLDLKENFRSNITATVEENLMNSLSLHQLAVLSGRSLSSFRRDFLAIYNTPPSEWIRQKRLEKSQELLLNTTMTVTDLCYTLGFENVAHFSRLFKSQFGYSPSQFRLCRSTA
jgi:AraC-like DNA-binding protein